MPFYKVPATSSVVASSSAPFAVKHQSTNDSSSSTSFITGHRSTAAAGVDDITWGDSSDRSFGSGGGGGGGNLAELTEADRDSELLRRDLEQRVQLSQVERRKMDHVNGHMELYTSGPIHRRTNGVIEEELLAQHRREEELASTRQYVKHHSGSAEDYENNAPPFGVSSANYEPSYDEPLASSYAHPGESRIVQELMEQRRREVELRGRWKEMGFTVPDEMNANETPFTLPEPKPIPHKGTASRRDERDYYTTSDAASPRRESTESAGLKVRPYEDPDQSSERKLAYIPANETPIEREIRLAGEREDALRQARGLLPLGVDPQGRDAMNVEIEVTSSNGSHYQVADPSVKVSMKKLASNRLQLELLKEKEREVALRSQGAIHTISEERAGEPVKYVEIISKQLADSPSPIPFKCPPGTMHSTETKQVAAGANCHTIEGRQVSVEVKASEPIAASAAVNGRARHSISGQSVERVNELEAVFGGRLQRQEEEPMMMMRQKSSTTKPTAAERKILSELMEMQMREQELKSQRQSISLSSYPNDSFDANSPTYD